MLINMRDDQLAKYRQESFSIWFLSITHVIYSYKFPMYARFGEPWSTIMWLAVSGISIVAYVLMFSSAHTYIEYFEPKASYLLPYGQVFKNCAYLFVALIGLGAMYYFWRIDYYHMPTLDYILLYGHLILTFILFYRAVYREAVV